MQQFVCAVLWRNIFVSLERVREKIAHCTDIRDSFRLDSGGKASKQASKAKAVAPGAYVAVHTALCARWSKCSKRTYFILERVLERVHWQCHRVCNSPRTTSTL